MVLCLPFQFWRLPDQVARSAGLAVGYSKRWTFDQVCLMRKVLPTFMHLNTLYKVKIITFLEQEKCLELFVLFVTDSRFKAKW